MYSVDTLHTCIFGMEHAKTSYGLALFNVLTRRTGYNRTPSILEKLKIEHAFSIRIHTCVMTGQVNQYIIYKRTYTVQKVCYTTLYTIAYIRLYAAI